jgi:Flp pilus assembly secretin CpaC
MRASALMRALVSEPPMPRLSIAVITAVLALAGLPAQAQSPNGALNVEIDRSARVQLRGAAASVIVANPQIADVTVVDANTLFIVGKGYGVTEVVAVDGVGRTLFQREIVVTGGSTGSVRVWRGAQATEMTCGASCAPSLRAGAAATGPASAP